MTDNNQRMSVGFYLSDALGNSYKTNVTEAICPEVGYTEWQCFMTQLNNFLKSCGYSGLLLDRLLSEEEVDFLKEQLYTYREEKCNI